MSPKVKRPQDADIKKALKRLLGKLGWSQAALARELGVHRQTVGDWVREKAEPGYGVGKRLVALSESNATPPQDTPE